MAFIVTVTRDHLNTETPDTGRHLRFFTTTEDAPIVPTHSRTFRAYDDDGVLYYTGTLEWDDDSALADGSPDDDALWETYSYFARYAGCTSVKYHGKPGWTIC